ncbi:hypothetical protein BKA66DRAFT_131948 [Pyrenochaeta sp. MPI-SDFR-AT-0127]|nr:hypothetical protein BKA66DRAFT_131948 [Pyrenochaeta sp. MPI-SDFR-AT-0127]
MSASPTRATAAPVELGWSSERLDLRNEKEDWTGVTNPAERRKLQNRLNQRARRARAHKKASQLTEIPTATSLEKRNRRITSTRDDSLDTNSPHSGSTSVPKDANNGCITASPRVQALMRRFSEHAYTSYMQGAPALSHLPLLVKFNLSNALARNAALLGVTSEYYDWNGISPLNKKGPGLGVAYSQRMVDWPASLQPTQLQYTIEHHPWVDLFPWPKLRDNLLQAFEHPEICDEDELCHDICDLSNPEGQPMLIVWGSPWDPRNWEVGTNFLSKWAWLLSGCEEIINATNYWRLKRGEKPLTSKDLQDAIRSCMPRQLSHSEL